MDINIKQISSLDKVFDENTRTCTEVYSARVLRNERFSYQLAITAKENGIVGIVSVEFPDENCVRVYREHSVTCDLPTHATRDINAADDNYLTFNPTLIPDILEPVTETNGKIRIYQKTTLLWVRVDVPENFKPGEYKLVVKITNEKGETADSVMNIEVLDMELPKPKLIYTNWFHADCIASYYNVPIYSERHWELIDSFIKTAADVGINMLLSPVHNPPLDTAVGHERPNVQLVKISRNGDAYTFDFSRFERWVDICKKYGIKYYEMPHFFSQWGAVGAPNIYVDGEHMFGVHTAGDSEEYVNFLTQYLNALINELKKLGIYENTYFHISDEPNCDHLETYIKCRDILMGINENLKIIDAMSHIEFYETGAAKIPIPASNFVEPFLKKDIEERWIYYCCGQGNKTSNRFIAMSSFRNRIMGVQMYKFNMQGFLHWGYNFYFSECSLYEINPYLTTSADCSFPSGDAFSVYPGKNGALLSIRALVFYEALQDMELCRLLEEKTSHEYVVRIIDEIAGKDVRFADMPEDEMYLFKLRERLIDELCEF